MFVLLSKHRQLSHLVVLQLSDELLLFGFWSLAYQTVPMDLVLFLLYLHGILELFTYLLLFHLQNIYKRNAKPLTAKTPLHYRKVN